MGTTSTKKKFSFWKLILWVVVIVIALNAISDGEFGDWLSSVVQDGSASQPDLEQRAGYLGITLEDKEDIIGGYISKVESGGPGADAGLLPGDIIVSIENTAVNSRSDVFTQVSRYHAGDSAVFTVWRNDQYLTLEVLFGVKPMEEATSQPTTVPQESIPGVTNPTNPSTTNPTNPSTTNPTKPSVTNPTTPSTTNPTKPSVTNPTTPSTTNPTETIPPQIDRLPSVPEELRNHVYLGSRDRGFCEKLTGKVVVTVIFVSDPEAAWTKDKISEVQSDLLATVSRIKKDAVAYGAQVDLSLQYKTVSVSTAIVDGDETKWVENALTAAGLPGRAKINTALEATYGADSAPVVFVANHGGRANAVRNSSGNEYAVLYKNAHAFYHELSHLFGAEDFYFPNDVKKLAETYLPNSIMVNSSEGNMEDLTAYLIGWTDSLSSNALAFLKSTAYLTKEYLASEKEKESYTGYVTDYTYDGGSYTGYLVDGVKHGQGKWVREDGTVWVGTFNYGVFSGTGNYIYSSGDTYDGQWLDGMRHGTGTYKWADGDSYTGAFVENKRTGKGTWTGASGNTYTGDFLNGVFHGYGTYTWADGSSYTGEFQNGNRSGQGTWTGSSGNTYTGDFVDGVFHGYGTFTWTDGASYTGGYQKGNRSGQGTMVYNNGAVYEGQWLDDKRHGQGTYTDTDGFTYVGQWKDNARNGQGTATYANGNSYVGNWVNNTWNGQGTFTWTSGDKYTGNFVDGKRNGYGIYYYPSGNRYEGQWVNGERHGQGTMYFASGTIKTGTWNNGVFEG